LNAQDHRGVRALDIYSIGPKLRALRQQKGLTLSRLATETGLSTGLLSKLETDRMIPTLPTLSTISRVFGVGLSFFFAEPTRHRVSITRKTSRGEQEKGPKGALKSTPLNLSTDSHLLARIVEFQAGHAVALAEAGTTLSAVVHLIEGRLQFRVGTGEPENLEAGDCVCLETDMLISWSATQGAACRALIVTPR
jgi:transcriptional regulator with XRE-family HTH domain